MTVYLDHAATTPMQPGAREALVQALEQHGNASSLHTAGRAARTRLEEARELLARCVGAAPHEVIFTGSGTESDNLALKGLYWRRRQADPARRRVLISAVEHHAVLDAAVWLAQRQDADVVQLPVDEFGVVRLDAVEREIGRDPASVALVSVMSANNEVGTLQPLTGVVELAAAQGIPVHTDAAQSLSWTTVDFAASGVDAMTLSAHKCGGPLGVAALVLRRGVDLEPLLHGGLQERQLHSGTVNVPGAVAFAAAAEWSVAHRADESSRVAMLRDRLVDGVRAAVPEAILRGDPTHRLANNAHFTFPGCEGDSLLYLLDAAGIECSTGSACTAGVPQPSHVLLAMGLDEDDARGALRFSLGVTSTQADVDAAVAAIGPVVERARNAGLAGVANHA